MVGFHLSMQFQPSRPQAANDRKPGKSAIATADANASKAAKDALSVNDPIVDGKHVAPKNALRSNVGEA